MQRTPPFPFLPDLGMPLRDAMRGVTNFAEATEEALQPAALLLPEPLRDGFRSAIKLVETTGKQWIDRPISHGEIHQASDFLVHAELDNDPTRNFAKVFCFAWEQLQEGRDAQRYLISETLIANKLGSLTADQRMSAPTFAVRLLQLIQHSSAIGRMPGFAESLDQDQRSKINASLVTIMVWLLSARSKSVEDEVALLDLAGALICAIQGDIDAALDDPEKLAMILENASAHL